ncbi:hypothetical protein PSYTB_14635 [Pseudomonas amygdali pv. tabaci str. ATCC 11528]|nr:hypothetical protein PSYTB_14635 [Pseudomonas amygdali pv. tabaci str. ATCC 11528]
MERGELEKTVWQHAAQSYGRSLTEILKAALECYSRPPGHDDMTRLYRQGIGSEAFTALHGCLSEDWRNLDSNTDFLWLRSHKRDYLYRHILQRLIQDDMASDSMRDSLFSIDLGV